MDEPTKDKPRGEPNGSCKLTPELADKLILLLTKGNYITVACTAVGVTKDTYANWMRWGEERPGSVYALFRARVLAATAAAETDALDAWHSAFGKDWKAASTFLARRFHNRWGAAADDPKFGKKKTAGARDLSRYRDDPVAFAQDVLGVTLWDKQKEILQALVVHRRVMVKSANAVGKTVVAAVAAVWFHACFQEGVGLVTAPRLEQVKDITFKEIRKFYHKAGDPAKLKPRNPEIFDHPGHFLKGTTASDSTAYQGHHADNLLVVFEEATAIEGEFWEAASGMLAGGENAFWLSILNPTDTSSTARQEELSGRWHVIDISALDHPNIAAELRGEDPPYPSAVRLKQLRDNLAQWAAVVPDPADRRPTDFTFDGVLYRPKPECEARVLGRYPSQAATSVYDEASFDRAAKTTLHFTPEDPVEIGCDVARFGDDRTAIHVRRGPVSLEHVTYHGRDTAWTAGKLKELCRVWAARSGTPDHAVDPKTIAVKVDDTGVGGSVVDQREDFNFVPVNSASRALCDDYPNKRSELLFDLAELLARGAVDLTRIDATAVDEVKRQACSLGYRLDAKGRRVVEGKDETKRRLKRSPDDLDAMALAYYKPYRDATFV